MTYLAVSISADTINLVIALCTLLGIMAGALIGADKLLGRRIERHQTVILANSRTLELKIDEAISEIGTLENRVNALDHRVEEQDKKNAYVQGQSDTMLKVVELLASMRGSNGT